MKSMQVSVGKRRTMRFDLCELGIDRYKVILKPVRNYHTSGDIAAIKKALQQTYENVVFENKWVSFAPPVQEADEEPTLFDNLNEIISDFTE